MPSPSQDKDHFWLSQCTLSTLPVPPFDRYIYMLPSHVAKISLVKDETGYEEYIPDTITVLARDENEMRVLDLFYVFTRIRGVTIFEGTQWDSIPAH
ncbi:hypothetical protein BDW69DRAFT_189122 [Aspergillus filifer]